MLRNWRDERDSAVLYDALAGIERNPRLSGVFRKLAASERGHCAYWEEQLRSQHRTVPQFRSSLRTRLTIGLARRFGVGFVLPNITIRELADGDRYSSQPDVSATRLSAEERGHAAVMRRIAAYGHGSGEEDALHAGNAAIGNNLRAAVLGANDGLASNFCLMMGMAGGGVSASTILLSGLAGLVAGACSMALGEWLSVTNSLEMTKSQMDGDARELHTSTAWKREELALIYEARGMPEDEAKGAADRVIAHDRDAVTTLIHEEQTLASAQLGTSPASAAVYSFALFAGGACIPLIPFLFATSRTAILASVGLSLLALLIVGLLTSFFNGRSPWFSGVRQVVIGAGAAAVTYGAGRLVGVVLG
jgi:VIT1/CCC1 family predicted Fe2+/Mn2+ transporter